MLTTTFPVVASSKGPVSMSGSTADLMRPISAVTIGSSSALVGAASGSLRSMRYLATKYDRGTPMVALICSG